MAGTRHTILTACHSNRSIRSPRSMASLALIVAPQRSPTEAKETLAITLELFVLTYTTGFAPSRASCIFRSFTQAAAICPNSWAEYHLSPAPFT